MLKCWHSRQVRSGHFSSPSFSKLRDRNHCSVHTICILILNVFGEYVVFHPKPYLDRKFFYQKIDWYECHLELIHWTLQGVRNILLLLKKPTKDTIWKILTKAALVKFWETSIWVCPVNTLGLTRFHTVIKFRFGKKVSIDFDWQ